MVYLSFTQMLRSIADSLNLGGQQQHIDISVFLNTSSHDSAYKFRIIGWTCLAPSLLRVFFFRFNFALSLTLSLYLSRHFVQMIEKDTTFIQNISHSQFYGLSLFDVSNDENLSHFAATTNISSLFSQ